jgi:ABC-type sugar transport system ATPase subunit
VLVARGISRSFGVVQALDAVDFEIGGGEIVALAGENGSGKSTFAKILAGALLPDAGTIALDGETVQFTRPRDALDRGVALVTQEPTACRDLSIAENVLLTALPGALAPFVRRRYVERARALLGRIGIDVDPALPFGALRAGDRELAEVAKALATGPRFLILDEATSRLGEHDVERLFRILRSLKEEGTSTIVITHRLPEIVAIADRAVVLRDGRRVGELSGAKLSEERLSSMMVGRELKDFFHKRRVEIGEPVLRVEELVVDASPHPVSFEVRAGEVVGLAGLVGSGRTELLETIAGVRRPRGGRVLVDGAEATAAAPARALRRGIALVPEERHRQGLVLGGTVRENIVMGTWRLLFTHPRRDTSTARRVVQRLGIRTAGVGVAVLTLSGGNQQKVVVGRCLTRAPRVLLLDEPTRGIDVGAKEEMFRLIGEMLGEGIAILLVSSDVLEILGLADRVLVMHEGRIVGELPRDEATEARIVHLSAGGRDVLDAA